MPNDNTARRIDLMFVCSSHNSWEPEENLCHLFIVQEYVRKKNLDPIYDPEEEEERKSNTMRLQANPLYSCLLLFPRFQDTQMS